MFLHSLLRSAAEGAARLCAGKLHLFVMNLQVGLDIVLRLPRVLAQLTLEGLLHQVLVPDVVSQGGGGRTRHVALKQFRVRK